MKKPSPMIGYKQRKIIRELGYNTQISKLKEEAKEKLGLRRENVRKQ